MNIRTRRSAIPNIFHSDSTGAPFQTCLGCDMFLLEDDVDYVIEKAYRRYPNYKTQDTVFEYAMCFDCLLQLQEAMSRESVQRVQAYFDRHVDFRTRSMHLLEKEELRIEDWVSSCMIKGTPVDALTEYQIFGHCTGTDLHYTLLPYAIGGEAIDEIGALLSNKTIGEIDGFMDEHFGLPPELRKLLLENNIFLL